MKGVSGIRSALETGDNRIVASKYINNLTLSLVAPLEAENYI